MSDANLRALERAAQSGDPEAAVRLVLERLRAGLPLKVDPCRAWIAWFLVGSPYEKAAVLGSWCSLVSDDDTELWDAADGKVVGRTDDGQWFYGRRVGASGCETCGWGGSPSSEEFSPVDSLDSLALLLPQDFVRALLAS